MSTEEQVEKPEVDYALLAINGLSAASRLSMAYFIPFLAQLGFGQSLGSSAIRAGLIGTTDATLAIAATILSKSSVGPVAIASGLGIAYQNLATGLVYSSFQYVVDLRSQGFAYDWTFATLSAATASYTSANFGSIAMQSLALIRGQNIAAISK